MLQLLARSSTGQKLSVYTNIITGPRRKEGEPDGPDELHVIIVDNGRSRVLGSDMAEILYCIRCGACLNSCPVYQKIGGHAYGSVYSGPIGAVLTPSLYGIEAWSDLPHASSLCGACREVCPVRIDIPRLLLKLRDKATVAGRSPGWLRLGIQGYQLAVVRPGLYRLGGRLAGWGSQILARNGWFSRLPGPLARWTNQQRDFPAFAKKSFHQRWREQRGRQGKG
jgi:L-lactate dehydrogenase complex protein LldF